MDGVRKESVNGLGDLGGLGIAAMARADVLLRLEHHSHGEADNLRGVALRAT
jgi:hypothetical protein